MTQLVSGCALVYVNKGQIQDCNNKCQQDITISSVISTMSWKYSPELVFIKLNKIKEDFPPKNHTSHLIIAPLLLIDLLHVDNAAKHVETAVDHLLLPPNCNRNYMFYSTIFSNSVTYRCCCRMAEQVEQLFVERVLVEFGREL